MRLIGMRALGALACGVLLAAACVGCGDEPTTGSEPTQWRGCDHQAFDAAGGRFAQVDVDGEDAPVVIKLVTGEGPCAGGLVATYGDRVVGHDVSGLDLDPDSAEVVSLGDGQTLLRLDSSAHPRGGFQPHLFAVGDGLAEVRVDGAPLLPFVATDGGAAPSAVRCGPDGTIEMLRATTSKPPGVVLAWDVHRTTYEVDGADAVETGSKQIRDHAADPLLHEQMPGLFDATGLLDDCGH